VPGFNDRLLTALPSLREHPCTLGTPGGFIERLEHGTHIPHILEHVALDLQNLTGSDVGFGRVVESGDAGVWWVIVAYDEEDVGLQSMRDAVSLVRAALGGPAFDIHAAVAELRTSMSA
jgi:cyanophycin synthetase